MLDEIYNQQVWKYFWDTQFIQKELKKKLIYNHLLYLGYALKI